MVLLVICSVVQVPGCTLSNNLLYGCRILLSDLVQATGSPELLLQVQLTPSAVLAQPHTLIPQLLAWVTACPRPLSTDSQHIMPLDHFFHTELQAYSTLIEQVVQHMDINPNNNDIFKAHNSKQPQFKA